MQPVSENTWIFTVGRRARQQPYTPALCIFAALIFIGLGLYGTFTSLVPLPRDLALAYALPYCCFPVSAMCLLLALIWYERRRYFEIIEQQRDRIAELEGCVLP
jgi:hypothetical protein